MIVQTERLTAVSKLTIQIRYSVLFYYTNIFRVTHPFISNISLRDKPGPEDLPFDQSLFVPTHLYKLLTSTYSSPFNPVSIIAQISQSYILIDSSNSNCFFSHSDFPYILPDNDTFSQSYMSSTSIFVPLIFLTFASAHSPFSTINPLLTDPSLKKTLVLFNLSQIRFISQYRPFVILTLNIKNYWFHSFIRLFLPHSNFI